MRGGRLVLIALTLAGAAARAGEPEADALGKRVAELEHKVAKLQAVVDSGAWFASRRDAQQAERTRLCARMDALRVAVLGRGAKAAGSKELAALLAFAKHPDGDVRRYLVATLAELPAKIAGEPLAGLVDDENFRTATEAVNALRRLGDGRAKERAAARTRTLLVHSAAPDFAYRRSFRDAACAYLVAQRDARGIDIYVRHLALKLAERDDPLPTSGRIVTSSSTYMIKEIDRLAGGPAGVFRKKKRYLGSDEQLAAMRKLVAWWKANGKDFKFLDPATAPVAGPGPVQPQDADEPF